MAAVVLVLLAVLGVVLVAGLVKFGVVVVPVLSVGVIGTVLAAEVTHQGAVLVG